MDFLVFFGKGYLLGRADGRTEKYGEEYKWRTESQTIRHSFGSISWIAVNKIQAEQYEHKDQYTTCWTYLLRITQNLPRILSFSYDLSYMLTVNTWIYWRREKEKKMQLGNSKTYWKGRNSWRPPLLKRRGPSGLLLHFSQRFKHLARYAPCWAATYRAKD